VSDLGDDLRRAALDHCARYLSSERGLRRVLERRLRRRLAATAAQAGADPPGSADLAAHADLVVAAVAACRRLGVVDDRTFAEAKVASGRRRGHAASRLAQDLAVRGVDRSVAEAVLKAEGGDERMAALRYARRKRLGPYRTRDAADPTATERRELAALGRAGHRFEDARWVLGLSLEAAEALAADPDGAAEA
jgi:regulatory protein